MNKLMKKHHRTTVLIIMVMTLFVLSGCSSNKSTTNDKLTVAVSIIPEEAIVKAIAGDLVEVTTIIPPGASPSNYQPTPKQIEDFSNAKYYFSIGVPTEEANIFPSMVDDRDDLNVIHLDELVEEVYPARFFEEDAHEEGHEEGHEDAHEEEHEEGHDHSGEDPHIWMSPKRMIVMSEAVYEVLIEADPDNAKTYQQNKEDFVASLQALDTSLSETLSLNEGKSFIIMHPSMGYFADDYGLTMVALEEDGKESTAAHLQEVIDYANEHDIKVVFYQEEFDSTQAQTLAEEIDGKVMALNPLSGDYINNMEAIGDIFKEALK